MFSGLKTFTFSNVLLISITLSLGLSYPDNTLLSEKSK